MAMFRSAPVLASASLLVCASAAQACPVCHSATGFAVRAALFDGRFFQTLALVALPCPLLLAAVALVHWTMPDLGEREPRGQSAEGAEVPSGAAA